MARDIPLQFSDRYREKFPDLAFGIGTIQNCAYFEKSEAFKLYKREVLRKMRRRANLAEIERRIALYDQFFKAWGYSCPLPYHLKRTIEMGFPIHNLFIDTHIIAEMSYGILMAIQDLDRFEGSWTLDLANSGESYMALSERRFFCKQDEIVLRDQKEIVCSLFQGPDFKTRVDSSSRNIVIYVFTAPGIEEEYVSNSLQLALEILEKFGKGKDPWLKVFKP